MATINYTDEDVASIVVMYNELGNEGLTEIANKYNKPIKSVRAKLVNLGVYVPIPKGAIRSNGKTKKEIMRDLYNIGIDPTGLEGATKAALKRVAYVITTLVAKESSNAGVPEGISGEVGTTLFKLLDIKDS